LEEIEREALRAEGLDPDNPEVLAAIDLVRWELQLFADDFGLTRAQVYTPYSILSHRSEHPLPVGSRPAGVHLLRECAEVSEVPTSLTG